jgi:flagellar hook protein FlgE
MMRSLYSGITGLRNHQTRMDVIGNNISNVNTAGFKASRVIFQDIYSQTLRPASSGNGTTTGGTNPQQIGLGSKIATIDVLHTKSAAQYTGNDLDLSIEGDGYFTVSGSGGTTYTRAGNFYTDTNNYLVNANGDYVQGFTLNASGDIVLDATTGEPTLSKIYIDPAYYDISIDESGSVIGVSRTDSSVKKTLGILALATFGNENALEKVGDSSYSSTANSGEAVYAQPGEDGAGSLNPGTLEMSNVDLATEFSDMIVTQRGFQANSRIITTTDSMLEELVNLKR